MKISYDVIIAKPGLLFTYAQRFYGPQFITRKIDSSKIMERMEQVVTDCFKDDELVIKELLTVESVDAQLHLSTKYLGSLLKQLTG